MKNIFEELSSPLAKKKWRELVKKYHPDVSSKSDEIIRKINNAKDKGDASLLTLYKELTGKKVDVPLSLQQLRDLQDKWGEDIKEKGRMGFTIYEIFPDIEKENNSITILIRFGWDDHYIVTIKNGERYKTKDAFTKAVRERIEKKVESLKRKLNKEAGEELYTLKKKRAESSRKEREAKFFKNQQKRRKRANLKDLNMRKDYK